MEGRTWNTYGRRSPRLGCVSGGARLAAVGMLLTGLLAACGTSSKGSTGNSGGSVGPESTVAIAVQPGSGTTNLADIAQKLGMYKKYGINATLIPVANGPAAVAALLGGSVQIAITAPEAFDEAIEKGAHLQLMMGQTKTIFVLGARPGLHLPTTFPASVRALKGSTIGVAALASAASAIQDSLLTIAGLSPNSVTLDPIGVKGAPYLLSGRVQTAQIFGPAIPEVLAAGGKIVAGTDLRKKETCPTELNICGIANVGMWGQTQWIAGHPTAILGIRKAIAATYVYMEDPANRKAVTNLLAADLPVNAPNSEKQAYYKEMLYTIDAAFPQADLQKWLNFDLKFHVISRAIPVQSVYAPGTPGDLSAVKALAS